MWGYRETPPQAITESDPAPAQFLPHARHRRWFRRRWIQERVACASLFARAGLIFDRGNRRFPMAPSGRHVWAGAWVKASSLNAVPGAIIAFLCRVNRHA
jgi:hypothetical protein